MPACEPYFILKLGLSPLATTPITYTRDVEARYHIEDGHRVSDWDRSEGAQGRVTSACLLSSFLFCVVDTTPFPMQMLCVKLPNACNGMALYVLATA